MFETEFIARANELTFDSIQDALRMYFQPVKSDDPQLDFYTMYNRETTEYDTKYMEKYNEDLNTTLIFVRFHPSKVYCVGLTKYSGRFILRGQLRFRNRCPVEARGRLQRAIRSLPPCHSS